MKVTLDLDKLLEERKITQAEFDKLSELAAHGTSALAFNILIGFGVVAVSGAALALVPTTITAIVLGLIISTIGLLLIHTGLTQWKILANICLLVGALMLGGGVIQAGDGSISSFLIVAAIFAAAGVFAHSALLIVLAILALSSSVGARTGYFHATYFLGIKEPTVTIALFSILAIGLYQLSKQLSADYERLAIAASRTALFLVNFGFWIGSLWGDQYTTGEIIISDWVFAVLWGIALIATAVWAWKRNRRWVLNTVAVFGGIHFYTQWFEYLGATPGTVLIAGLLALGFAVGLRGLNVKLKESA